MFPDNVVRGAMYALLEAGVRVPEDLRLVLHRNAEIDIHSPVPASWLVSAVADYADAMIRQIRRQVAGEDAGAEVVRLRIETSEDAGVAARGAGVGG